MSEVERVTTLHLQRIPMDQYAGHLEAAVAAAKEAGRIQNHHFNRSYKVEYKGEINPVTEVDRLCEEAIVGHLHRAFPDHDILTEETPFEGKGSALKWIVDPLDGTTNYIHGYPCFCVSIGLEVEGALQLGVVYDPVHDELFHALKGAGAYLNRSRISVSRNDNLDSCLLGTGFPYDIRESGDYYLSFFRAFMLRSLALRRPGSGVLDLCYVAAGRFDGFWEMKLLPWDMAAGALLVLEAGGMITDFQGCRHSIYGQETLASNGLIHDQMLEVMREVKDEWSRRPAV